MHRKENGDAQRQPGLDNLDELLDNLRTAGLPARLTSQGGPRVLPGSLDIALYRIAQEALTNALRHGSGGTVEIDLGRCSASRRDAGWRASGSESRFSVDRRNADRWTTGGIGEFE